MASIDYRHAELTPAAIGFIAAFLRFEFALKEAGFCTANDSAAVDWGRVTKKGLGPTFFAIVAQSGNAETMLKRPPKKQIAVNHTLDFEEQDPPRSTHDLFEAVRRVRNNLVHGGKSGHPDADVNDPERNEKLMRESQWIIEQALGRMDAVRDYFEGRY